MRACLASAFHVASVASFLVLGASARAEASEPSVEPPSSPLPRNALQADLGLAVVGAAYERVLAPYLAVQVEAQIFGIWWAEPHFTGGGAQLRPTLFLQGDAPRGVYVAPFVRVDRVKAKSDAGVSGTGTGWSSGVFVGYSFVFGRAFNLRLGAGAQYMSYDVDPGGAHVKWKKPYPALDLVVGWML